MKRIGCFLMFLLLLSSCTVNKAPEFIGIENLKFSEKTNDAIELNADLKFHNPNDIGCELSEVDIDVKVNDVSVGKLSELQMTKIDKNNDFSIPTTIQISPKEFFGSNLGGLLGGALNAILNKEIKVNYSGKVKLKKLGIPFEIPIDKDEVVQLK